MLQGSLSIAEVLFGPLVFSLYNLGIKLILFVFSALGHLGSSIPTLLFLSYQIAQIILLGFLRFGTLKFSQAFLLFTEKGQTHLENGWLVPRLLP